MLFTKTFIKQKIFTKIIIAGLVIGLGFGIYHVAVAADDGLWYFKEFKVQQAHDAGFDGKGVTIAVMDGPINDQVPALADSNIELQPSLCLDSTGKPLPTVSTATGQTDQLNAIHATDVVSLIAGSGKPYPGQPGITGVAPGARILYYAVTFNSGLESGEVVCDIGDGSKVGVETALAASINDAIDKGAKIISISLGINGTADLSDAIARAHREGLVVLGALPNHNLSNVGDWPGNANGVVAVQAIDAAGRSQIDIDGVLHTAYPYTTVAGPGIGILVQGTPDGAWTDQRYTTGTSLATPVVAGFLALVSQKYPNATANQLIQTLIHNTGIDDHDLAYDQEIGYGIASVTHMLNVDPTRYPDENPLLVDTSKLPSLAESLPKSASADNESMSKNVDLIWVFIIGGTVMLLIAGAAIVIIVMKRKSWRARQAQLRAMLGEPNVQPDPDSVVAPTAEQKNDFLK